jgi:hypothetical protein
MLSAEAGEEEEEDSAGQAIFGDEVKVRTLEREVCVLKRVQPPGAARRDWLRTS